MRKTISLMLAMLLLLTTFGALAEEYPSYLNLDSITPVVKEGEDAPTLKVAVLRQTGGGDWDELWIAHYIEEILNVNLDVTMIESSEALAEYKTLMFASGELPDIMMNLGLTTSELVTYGQINGQLLAIDEYISEALTPNIWQWFEEVPEYRASSTALDGHIYSLPKMWDADPRGDFFCLYINNRWLKETGLESPTTLDEFIDVLRAFKAQNPDCIPLNGGIDAENPGYAILNAMGFSGIGNGYGYDPVLLNGEFALPCYTDLFKEYLTVMKQLYDEGLISSNFFLANDAEVTGNVVSDITGICCNNPFLYGIDTFSEWEGVAPLTSQWNDSPSVYFDGITSVGGFAISADTKYPELCLRLADVFFDHDYRGRMLWIGPADGSEDAVGWPGNVSTDSGEGWTFPEESYPDGVSDLWSWLVGYVSFYPTFGSNDLWSSLDAYSIYMGGEHLDFWSFDMTQGNDYGRAKAIEKCQEYLSKVNFPKLYYLTEETAMRLADLETVIEPYVKQQVAMFISGDRSLDEFDAYLEELKGIGIEEMMEIYETIWDNYKAAL